MDFEISDFEMMEAALRSFEAFLLRQNVDEEAVFDSRLISCELLSNVLQHTKGRAFLRGNICGDYIEIEVNSTVRYRPPDKTVCSDVYADSGRGLYLVDCLSERRECTPSGGIKVYIKIAYKK